MLQVTDMVIERNKYSLLLEENNVFLKVLLIVHTFGLMLFAVTMDKGMGIRLRIISPVCILNRCCMGSGIGCC